MKKMFYIGVLLGGGILAACTAEEEREAVDTPVTLEKEEAGLEKEDELDIVQEAEAAPLELTQQQKEAYHKRYVETAEWANQLKIGVHIEIEPIEQFKDEHWRDPEVLEKEIQGMVEHHMAEERELLEAVTPKENKATLQVDGKMAKNAYMYVSGAILVIEVAASFDTQYSETSDRQLFAGAQDISTQIVRPFGTWEQTSVEAVIIDGGRTYKMDIEGIWSGNGLSFEKAFNIEFRCDQYGNIY